MRFGILDDLGLDAAHRWLSTRFAERLGTPADLESHGTPCFHESVETQILRIAQEAVTNFTRHAQVTKARISLAARNGPICLAITGHGQGIKPAAPLRHPSLGMVGIRARVRHLGGTLLVENRYEGGLLLLVQAPLREIEPNAPGPNAPGPNAPGPNAPGEDTSFIG